MNEVKGGPGSGSWSGPGQPRFARSVHESLQGLSPEKLADMLEKLKVERYARLKRSGKEPPAEKPVEEKPVEEVSNEPPVEEAKDEEVLLEEPSVTEPLKEGVKLAEVIPTEIKKPVEPQKTDKDTSKEDMSVYKGVIGFKDLGTLPESEPWDGPGEEAKADIETLKIICAWFDSDAPDNKGSYKLPHHKADGHKVVWRGVVASMASLLGARGGMNVSDEDKKGIYNHLKKHYAQFDKEAPDFKMVEDQVLAKLDEEVHALSLEREDKYAVKLIKKVLKKQNENKYSSEQVKKALEVINLALSKVKN